MCLPLFTNFLEGVFSGVRWQPEPRGSPLSALAGSGKIP